MSGRIEIENKINDEIIRKLESLPKEVKQWNEVLIISRKTSATRKVYIQIIEDFFKSREINDTAEIEMLDVINYLSQKQTITIGGEKRVMSDSRMAQIWFALNSFFEFLKNINVFSQNFMDAIPKNKIVSGNQIKKEKELLTEKDFNAILEAIDFPVRTQYLTDLVTSIARDKCIIMLFMVTGMRKTALIEIDIDDIDMKEGTLRIIDKGRKEHIYYLQKKMLDVLDRWIKDREIVLYNIRRYTKALFVDKDGDRVTRSTIDNIVNKYTKEALGKPLSPHKLRAGFCSIMYNKTHDIEFVRRAVGHSNISTTQRYIVTSKEEKRKASEIMDKILK